MRVVNRANTVEEAQGIIFGFQEMRKKGYQLENVSLHYRGNQGLDMIFRSSNGPPVIYAVVEAKGGDKGVANVPAGQLRQGSPQYNADRIEKYLNSSDPAYRALAQQLLREARAGKLRSYVAVKGRGEITEVTSGLPSKSIK